MIRILIVDDSNTIRMLLKNFSTAIRKSRWWGRPWTDG